MPESTTNLGLYKVNPTTDGDNTFNIKTMLNDNWDKIDVFVGTVEQHLSEAEDLELAVNNLIQDVGDLTTLDTATKVSLVAAINEIYQTVATHKAENATEVDVLKKQYLNVLNYGAKGDGITDDTTAIKNAIADAVSLKKMLLFPSGEYVITSPVNAFTTGFFGIKGSGKNTTTIRYRGVNTTPLLTFQTSQMIQLLDIGIFGENNQPLIKLNGSFNLTAHNARFVQGNPCVEFTANAGDNHFTNCTFSDSELAILTDCQMNYFSSCNFKGNHINAKSPTGNIFDGLYFFECSFIGGKYKLNPSTWITGTAYKKGDLVLNNGNIYQSEGDGTSGATAPTHTTGSASDGTVSWAFKEAQTNSINKAEKHLFKQGTYGSWIVDKCWFEGSHTAVEFNGGTMNSIKDSNVASSAFVIKATAGAYLTMDTVTTAGEQNYIPMEYTFGVEAVLIQFPFSKLAYNPVFVENGSSITQISKRLGNIFSSGIDMRNSVMKGIALEERYGSRSDVLGRTYLDKGSKHLAYRTAKRAYSVSPLLSGTTTQRPTTSNADLVVGLHYFDTDLNSGAGMDIVWNGTNWVNPSTGATV
ncbi:glycoside hydrolase family 55 protein [Metabacillus litoralis]|uniref:glycoside hydrolase family 55 protein n=1 Tax=Metabacillus litoralis TaxID=152268 RepID=UPI00203B2996|nr:glycoside hydrolase family 55 protein [Metabacillus litoralis]MCM3411453.1 glycoside hydrolase family 55 protein [Metabacillus litoralis]